MRTLLVHQNFPGQFRYLAPALAKQPGAQVVALGDAANVRDPELANLRLIDYPTPRGASAETHHYLRTLEAATRRGQQVARAAMSLRQEGFRPDIILAYPGWGEALFLKDIWPDARLIHYFELFYNPSGYDVGFDPEYPAGLDDVLRLRLRNTVNLHALECGDWGLSPTRFQYGSFPQRHRQRISVIFDGVDTNRIAPDPEATLILPDGRSLSRDDAVLTFINRNLEPYRGFHVFMRALPELQARRPDLHCVIIGGDSVSYGRTPTGADSYRELLLREVGDRLNLERVHFLGRVPYETFLDAMRIGRVHLYLTYPFVLSWSLIEAMSMECAIAASATAPVREVITDGDTGLLFDFFDQEAMLSQIERLLDDAALRMSLGRRARAVAQAEYDLRGRCLPAQLALLRTIADGGTPVPGPLLPPAP